MFSKPQLFGKGAQRTLALGAIVAFFAASAMPLMAQEEGTVEAAEMTYETFMASPDAAVFMVSNLWILIATVLVASMHLGFAMLESGLCQAKNVTNILFKNTFYH